MIFFSIDNFENDLMKSLNNVYDQDATFEPPDNNYQVKFI